VIDLFNPKLPVLKEKVITPGTQALLYNLNRVADRKQSQVLAAAARIYKAQATANSYSFVAKSPAKTLNAMRVLLPAAPLAGGTVVKNSEGETLKDVKTEWDADSGTYFMEFENSPEGISVQIKW
jgi:hypothetical protein